LSPGRSTPLWRAFHKKEILMKTLIASVIALTLLGAVGANAAVIGVHVGGVGVGIGHDHGHYHHYHRHYHRHYR
jgi:hypothetical protein